MGLLETLIIALLIEIVLPVLFAIFGFFKRRGEKKIKGQEVVRTRPPRILSGFFLGFALLVLLVGTAGIIYCCITDAENTTLSAVITISSIVAFFSAVGFFGYAYVRFNYVVASNEGIVAYRLFRKTRYYRYDEIAYFKDTTHMGLAGGLIGYDKNNKKIFAIEAIHIGASAVVKRLREHGVPEKLQTYLHLNR